MNFRLRQRIIAQNPMDFLGFPPDSLTRPQPWPHPAARSTYPLQGAQNLFWTHKTQEYCRSWGKILLGLEDRKPGTSIT